MSCKTVLVALGLALTLLAGVTVATPGRAGPLDELVEVGSGELRWFGMEVYEARLLNSDGRYEGIAGTGPLALEITYRRNISRERLVATTEREWRRLGGELGLIGAEQVAGWLETLLGMWPDVSPGDRIIAFMEPGGPTRFYGNGGLLGVVPDPDFGPAFLGIWLHPDTRAPDLRFALIGARQ